MVGLRSNAVIDQRSLFHHITKFGCNKFVGELRRTIMVAIPLQRDVVGGPNGWRRTPCPWPPDNGAPLNACLGACRKLWCTKAVCLARGRRSGGCD